MESGKTIVRSSLEKKVRCSFNIIVLKDLLANLLVSFLISCLWLIVVLLIKQLLFNGEFKFYVYIYLALLSRIKVDSCIFLLPRNLEILGLDLANLSLTSISKTSDENPTNVNC